MASLLHPLLLAFLASLCYLPYSLASHVYVVGADKGWTLPSLAKLDYQKWVSTIAPQIGDSLEFDYNKEAHSVLQVTRFAYRHCNTSNAIATFQDGKTIIKLTNAGSSYFICGFPGHCEAGQKFMIRVANTTTAAAPVATIPPTFQPVVAPSGESFPPINHAIPPTTGAAADVRSSTVGMICRMVVVSVLSVIMIS